MTARIRPVVLITGAAQGIGAVFARRFSEAGYRVVAADLHGDGAQRVADELAANGGQATAIAVDVSDEDGTTMMARHALGQYGRIDVLINNAGLKAGGAKKLWEITVADWDRIHAVNARGVWLGMRAVFPAMREQGGGSIINIASSAVLDGTANFLHYIASKGAVVAMTRAAARELGEYGIRVNTILPGYIRTGSSNPHGNEDHDPRRIVRRPQTPDDLVGAALFLASDAASYVTGQLLDIDGGLTFV